MTLLLSSPPQPHSREDVYPALFLSWWCTCISVAIIAFRIIGRQVRNHRPWKLEDWVMMSIALPTSVRMALIHPALLYGTNNVDFNAMNISENEAAKRRLGSKLVPAARVFHGLVLVMAQFTMVQLLGRLTKRTSHRWVPTSLNLLRWFPVFTFVAMVAALLAECRPFSHYWQLQPDPGSQCRQSYGQLFTSTILNVFGDLCIAILPIYLVMRSRLKLYHKICLGLLFASSLVTAGTSLFRLVYVIKVYGDQSKRSLIASFQILVAVAVANASFISSVVRNGGKGKHERQATASMPPFSPCQTLDQGQFRGKTHYEYSTANRHRRSSNLDRDFQELSNLWFSHELQDMEQKGTCWDSLSSHSTNPFVRQLPVCDTSGTVTSYYQPPSPRPKSQRSTWHGEEERSLGLSDQKDKRPSQSEESSGCSMAHSHDRWQPKPPSSAHISGSSSSLPTDISHLRDNYCCQRSPISRPPLGRAYNTDRKTQWNQF